MASTSEPPGPPPGGRGSPGPETLRLNQLELRRREQAKLLVHDLRNPVAAIIGHLDLLRLELGEASPGASALLDDLGELSQKLLAMVGGLLDVEELEEGVLRAEAHTVKLADFLGLRVRSHMAQAKARLLDFQVDLPPDLEVSLDPDLVGRVLDNLLDNAIRYATRRGKVVLAAALDGGVLELRIGNDGPAVPEGDRERIFERYFRIEARRAAARENRGLGLYFCKLAVQAHGGTLEIAQTETLPCVFVVRLPQAA